MEPDDFLCSRNAWPPKDGEGAARCLSCSQNAHGERDWKDTHVGPVLPERAPSEGPRSTAALGPTCVSFQMRNSKQAWNDRLHGWCSSDARSERQPGHGLAKRTRRCFCDAGMLRLRQPPRRRQIAERCGKWAINSGELDGVHGSAENVPRKFGSPWTLVGQRLGSQNRPRATHSDIRSPRTSLRLVMTSGQSKNCSATRTSAPP